VNGKPKIRKLQALIGNADQIVADALNDFL